MFSATLKDIKITSKGNSVNLVDCVFTDDELTELRKYISAEVAVEITPIKPLVMDKE